MEPPAPDAEEILQRVVEAVPGGVVHVSAQGAVVRANPAACSFLGYSFNHLTQRYTQDFDGDTWFEDGTPCSVGAYPVTVALTEKRPAGPTTIGVQQPSGEVRWAVFRAVPLEGGGAIVTFLDITERKAAEARLRTSDRLASLGRLAAGMAHEVNNPLTSVVLHLERALESCAGCGKVTEIERAMDAVDRVSAIVRDLTTFARVEEDTAEDFDIHVIIAQAVDMTEAEVRHRAVLRVDEGDVARVLGVPRRATQILVNLVLNAAQSITPGSRDDHTITIRTRPADGGVRVTVSDTGGGIDASDLDHIFDPFYTTKPVGEGTGLGLSISRALTEAMGGRLELESATDGGTHAHLWLPAAPRITPSHVEPRETAQKTRAARVLVVDDEPIIRELLEWALEAHDVHTVESGRQALAIIGEQDFDLILCDLMMPDLTGMDLHRELSRQDSALAERMVFMTGGAFTPDARAFCLRDDVRCIEKPFRASRVRELVAEILHER